MVPFEYIPDELKPTKDKHVEYSTVFRALRGSDINKEDFYPSIVERNFAKKCKLFGESDKSRQEYYSVSLFTSAESLKLLFESNVGFRKNHQSIAKGFTTIKRGYSYKANQKGHVDYFLYDYLENNPYKDFTWYEEMNSNE